MYCSQLQLVTVLIIDLLGPYSSVIFCICAILLMVFANNVLNGEPASLVVPRTSQLYQLSSERCSIHTNEKLFEKNLCNQSSHYKYYVRFLLLERKP